MSRIADTHTELFHYTTAAGLSGILESKSLWATHSSFVNDEEEIAGFYDRILPRIFRPTLLKYFDEVKNKPEFQKELGDKTIENFCDEQVSQLIGYIKPVVSNFHDHYITSFSTPRNEWEREHGLLSQWRAYGPDGGYAIVFDTSTFDEILGTETSPDKVERFSWCDVQYHLKKIAVQMIERLING